MIFLGKMKRYLRCEEASMRKLRLFFKKTRLRCFSPFILCFYMTACAAPLIALGLGAAGGVAAYKYYEGTSIVVFKAPFMETWDATLAALEQMNMKVENSSYDQTSGKIGAKRTDNKPVYISVKYKSATETEVTIGVGPLGHKEGSDAIAKKIREILFEK
jgi:hypothetical protein